MVESGEGRGGLPDEWSSYSASKFKLIFDKAAVFALPFYQLFVCACFHHPTGIHHHNIVSIANGRQPVGHHHYRTPSVEVGQILHYRPLVQCVKRIGGFVKEYKLRTAVDCTGYEYPLLLP